MNRYNYSKPWNYVFKAFTIFSFVLISTYGFTQNQAVNTFSSDGISELIIDATQIFRTNINVVDEDLITISSLSDGEYGDKFKVVSNVVNGVLYMALQPTTIEVIPDDKRNAHKVIAAEVNITLPENLSIDLKSDIGSVHIKGDFNKINVELYQGSFNANATVKEAQIKTTDGHIFIETKDALIATDSYSGLVDIPNDMMGFSIWKLQTVSGNITVKKM